MRADDNAGFLLGDDLDETVADVRDDRSTEVLERGRVNLDVDARPCRCLSGESRLRKLWDGEARERNPRGVRDDGAPAEYRLGDRSAMDVGDRCVLLASRCVPHHVNARVRRPEG